jgi:hypothetical protein
MAKAKWYPRQGRRLSVGDRNAPTALENMAKRCLKKLPSFFLHPVLGLIVAALITFSGHSELFLRSVGLTVVGLWLILDLWAALLRKEWQWKFTAGWSGTSAILIVVMAVMWWWLDGKLEDQREAVSLGLHFSHYSAPGKTPKDTWFTVANDSAYAISGKHKLACFINYSVGDHGHSIIDGIWQAFTPDEITGKWRGASGADAHANTLWPHLRIGPSLQPGGDSETDECLNVIYSPEPECIDLTLIFLYSLEDQPTLKQEKDFRYIGELEDNTFVWRSEPLNAPSRICQRYATPPS